MTTTKSKTFKKVNSKEYQILLEQIKKYTKNIIKPESNLISDLGIDSISLLELQLFIEETFNIKIIEKNFHKIISFQELVNFIIIKKKSINKSKTSWKTIFKKDYYIKLHHNIWMLKITDFCFQIAFSKIINLSSSGRKNIPVGPCLIVPNHASLIDPIIAYTCLEKKFQNQIYFLAKEKHFNNFILKFYANNARVIVMHTKKNLKESLQKIGRALSSSKIVIYFPEGTRSKNGKIGEFKATFAHIAKEFNVPVIPTALKGVYESAPYPKIFPKKGNVSVHYLKPIYPGKMSEKSILKKTFDSIVKKLDEC